MVLFKKSPLDIQLDISEISKFNRIGIALSGGLDSVVLLHALHEALEDKSKLYVLHVNHGVSNNADFWQERCKELADSLGVEFLSWKLKLHKSSKISEDVLRKGRYERLISWASEDDVICTAHHQSDQIETVFFRFMRGTGIYGLAGIPKYSIREGVNFYRPLLDSSKEAIKEYAHQKELNWVEDESNLDTKITRNYIRNIVFPLLSKTWPNFSKSLLYLSRQSREAQVILDEVAESDFLFSRISSFNSLDLIKVNQLSEQRITNLMFFWLSRNSSLSLSGHQMENIVRVIIEKKENNDYFSLIEASEEKNTEALIAYKGRLYLLFHKNLQPLEGSVLINWNLKNSLELSTGKISFSEAVGHGLSIDLLKKNVVIKGREGGERFKPQGRDKSQKLKKLLQEIGIAPWLRDRIPLIYVGEELVAVGDLWISEKFKAGSNEKSISFLWQDSSELI